jgi:hypothetical protein
LIDRAGLTKTGQGRWRVSHDQDMASLSAAFCSALVLLAAGGGRREHRR